MPWLLNIKDKINISDSRFCPPHYIPPQISYMKENM